MTPFGTPPCCYDTIKKLLTFPLLTAYFGQKYWFLPMRRLSLLLLLFVLVLPAMPGAARSTPSDGSLGVTKASGTITVQGKGLIFGHFDRGTLTVVDYRPDDTTAPTVSGAKMKLSNGSLNVVYSGSDVRFLFPGGKYTLRIDGNGIDISAVGRGNVQVVGRGSLGDGSVSVNGAKAQPLTPATATTSFGGVTSTSVDKVTTTTSTTTNRTS